MLWNISQPKIADPGQGFKLSILIAAHKQISLCASAGVLPHPLLNNSEAQTDI